MPWVEFTADFNFVPEKQQMVSTEYKAGLVLLVSQECADRAKAAGKAKDTIKPKGATDDVPRA